METPRDPLVYTQVIASTPCPQEVCYLAMHQDYASEPAHYHEHKYSEAQFGEIVVKKCAKFGHWGVLEHPQITFNACYYPHSVISQARTHRVGISFDCQSFRYTSESLTSVDSPYDVEKAIYLRPVGLYTDRKGHKYYYTAEDREADLIRAYENIQVYKAKIAKGHSEEHARGGVCYDLRQHFVMSVNLRSALHFLDLRHKKDAQLEIQWFADDVFQAVKAWCPEIVGYYEENRLNKAKLAP